LDQPVTPQFRKKANDSRAAIKLTSRTSQKSKNNRQNFFESPQTRPPQKPFFASHPGVTAGVKFDFSASPYWINGLLGEVFFFPVQLALPAFPLSLSLRTALLEFCEMQVHHQRYARAQRGSDLVSLVPSAGAPVPATSC
jgi:hypothetical protein